MPLSRSRDYLSIGEVLDALKAEFPDTSISKIRFLESEGLISPERTNSGYRKFYDKDVDQLRYILELQRDHFLPLKVIKERLAGGGTAAPTPVPAPAAVKAEEAGPAQPSSSTSAPELTGLSLDRKDLLAASGLTSEQLDDLEEYGILTGADGTFDENDLVIAKAAKGFFDHGVEARHLRLYRQTTDRETAFIEQILAPSAARKDPQALKQAGEEATRLEQLSRSMRDAMLRSNVRALF